MGVMKAVGQAVRQGQSFCWDNDRMVHVLRCIGIAPWGYVKNRKCLECYDGKVCKDWPEKSLVSFYCTVYSAVIMIDFVNCQISTPVIFRHI